MLLCNVEGKEKPVFWGSSTVAHCSCCWFSSCQRHRSLFSRLHWTLSSFVATINTRTRVGGSHHTSSSGDHECLFKACPPAVDAGMIFGVSTNFGFRVLESRSLMLHPQRTMTIPAFIPRYFHLALMHSSAPFTDVWDHEQILTLASPSPWQRFFVVSSVHQTDPDFLTAVKEGALKLHSRCILITIIKRKGGNLNSSQNRCKLRV